MIEVIFFLRKKTLVFYVYHTLLINYISTLCNCHNPDFPSTILKISERNKPKYGSEKGIRLMKRLGLLFILIILLGTFTVVAQDGMVRVPISIDNAAFVVQLGIIDAGTTGIVSLAFNPNGKYIVSGDSEGVIKIWNLTNGEDRSMESPRKSWVSGLVFNPDGA